MRKKRNSFLTFVFSLLPGAGHMYMGFMRLGLSLMTAFFAIIFLSTFLRIGSLLFLLPMLWFYSFFDAMNRRFSSDEVFNTLEDNYLFSLDKFTSLFSHFSGKRNLIVGIVFVLFGGYLLWMNFLPRLWNIVPNEVYYAIRSLTDMAPQLLFGLLIIFIGVKLITGKKKESDKNA